VCRSRIRLQRRVGRPSDVCRARRGRRPGLEPAGRGAADRQTAPYAHLRRGRTPPEDWRRITGNDLIFDTALRQPRRRVSCTQKSRCSRRRAGTRSCLLMVPTGLSVAAVAGGRRSLVNDCAQMMIDFLAAPRRRRRPPGFDELTAREHAVRSGCADTTMLMLLLCLC
jgi:hypothetical protein